MGLARLRLTIKIDSPPNELTETSALSFAHGYLSDLVVSGQLNARNEVTLNKEIARGINVGVHFKRT